MSDEQRWGCGIVAGLLVGLVWLIANCTGISPNYSKGERSGVVWKFSEKGLMYVSGEGELNMGGVVVDSKGAISPVVWEFSCTDDDIKEKIVAAQRSSARVTLTYRQWLLAPFSIDTKYVIVDVAVDSVEAR
jgi:hypothetical protein